MKPIIGTSWTIRPPTSRATTDVACEHGDGELGRTRGRPVLDELDQLLDSADLCTEREHVADRDGDEEAIPYGLVERHPLRGRRDLTDRATDAVRRPAHRLGVGADEQQRDRDDADDVERTEPRRTR